MSEPETREPLIIDRTSEKLVSFPHAHASAPMVAAGASVLAAGKIVAVRQRRMLARVCPSCRAQTIESFEEGSACEPHCPECRAPLGAPDTGQVVHFITHDRVR